MITTEVLHMPMISVIVPVYNVEKYLHRCVDSILAQTFTDFELILVDDGSPDNCGIICDEYTAKDPRVRVIHQKNRGVSAARNAGLTDASGTYVMFCDGDDHVADNWIEISYSAMRVHPDKLIVHNLWNENEKEGKTAFEPLLDSDNRVELKSYYWVYQNKISGSVWNKVFCKRVIDEHCIRFDENRFLGEDVVFVTEYLKYVNGILYISTPLYYYVERSESAVRKYYWNLLSLHLPLFSARLPLIKDDEKDEFCCKYLAMFISMLDVVFEEQNTMPLLSKLHYNQKMVTSWEFQYCLKNAHNHQENPLIIRLLKMKNYYLYWLFCLLVQFKRNLRRRLK